MKVQPQAKALISFHVCVSLFQAWIGGLSLKKQQRAKFLDQVCRHCAPQLFQAK